MISAILLAIGCAIGLFVVLAAIGWFVIRPLHKATHQPTQERKHHAPIKRR